MCRQYLYTFFLLLLYVPISEAVKIGISKPVTATENVTIESIETTTPEPTETTTTTTISTTISITTKKIRSTTPFKTTATSSTTTSSTTTTTPLPSTTTTTSTRDLKNNSRPSPIKNINVAHDEYFCNCDLRHQRCDINCCCDIDCISEELNSFNCQPDENRLQDIHYQQGLPPCKINEGWLCVFRSNFDDTKHEQINYAPYNAASHEWPQLLMETNELLRDRNYYKIGEPVLLYNLEVNEIIEYDIPFSVVGQQCQIFEPIRHLTSQNTSCYATIEEVKNLEATLFQKLCTSFLLQTPNNRIPIDGIIKYSQTEFAPITLFRCTNDYDCIPAFVNSSTFAGFEDFDYSSLIQIKIYHNISNLISCDVLFFGSEQDKSDKVWQHYEVKFIHINETNEISFNVSGALGYKAGSPLIIGHKVVLNETADHIDSNLIFNYFHPNRTQTQIIHIYAPRRKKRRCEQSQSTVNFGESILVQCSVELDNSTELSSETNFTRVCEDLQSRSLQFLQVNDILQQQDDYYISILGYPINRTERWTKIEVANYEHLPVVGAYLDKDYAFICQNMILGVEYKFLAAADDVHGVPYQHVLKRATINVGRRHDLQFQLDEVISIPITFSVVFQDLREIRLSNAACWAKFCHSFFISTLILIYCNSYVYIRSE